MKWNIVYYNKVIEEQILAMPESLLARYLRMADLMIEMGPNIGMPHTKYMGDGLLELRLKGKEGIARVFYCVVMQHKIMILHSFIKKTQKTPLKELKLAKSRMMEVTKHARKNS